MLKWMPRTINVELDELSKSVQPLIRPRHGLFLRFLVHAFSPVLVAVSVSVRFIGVVYRHSS